jgi:hypothetical protein
VQIGGVQHYLGVFESEETAAFHYLKFLQQLPHMKSTLTFPLSSLVSHQPNSIPQQEIEASESSSNGLQTIPNKDKEMTWKQNIKDETNLPAFPSDSIELNNDDNIPLMYSTTTTQATVASSVPSAATSSLSSPRHSGLSQTAHTIMEKALEDMEKKDLKKVILQPNLIGKQDNNSNNPVTSSTTLMSNPLLFNSRYPPWTVRGLKNTNIHYVPVVSKETKNPPESVNYQDYLIGRLLILQSKLCLTEFALWETERKLSQLCSTESNQANQSDSYHFTRSIKKAYQQSLEQKFQLRLLLQKIEKAMEEMTTISKQNIMAPEQLKK